VSVIEPLGSETHIYVMAGKHQFIGKIEPQIQLTVDQKISLIPNMEKVKFFDYGTELAIR
jgi:multiple sugar transport system ATP-binding protein